MCFDYDKYYIYDKYGQLLAEYENKPRISENSGSVVARNADESFTCYDRDFNVILKQSTTYSRLKTDIWLTAMLRTARSALSIKRRCCD